MKFTIERKKKNPEIETSLPALYKYLGDTGEIGKVSQAFEESIIVLFFDDFNGIVVQVGVAITLTLGEVGPFIDRRASCWERCSSDVSVVISN